MAGKWEQWHKDRSKLGFWGHFLILRLFGFSEARHGVCTRQSGSEEQNNTAIAGRSEQQKSSLTGKAKVNMEMPRLGPVKGRRVMHEQNFKEKPQLPKPFCTNTPRLGQLNQPRSWHTQKGGSKLCHTCCTVSYMLLMPRARLWIGPNQ